MSSLNLLLELSEWVPDSSEVGVIAFDNSFSLPLAIELSKWEMRDAISAIIVFFARRFRGPGGGKVHSFPARVQEEQGSVLSHLVFLLLQLLHER